MLSLIKDKYINDEIIFIGDSEITDKKLALNCDIDFLRVHKDGDISDLGVLLYYINYNKYIYIYEIKKYSCSN